MSNKLIGTNPNQVPSNADLGTLAYQDADNVNIQNLKIGDANLGTTPSAWLQVLKDNNNSGNQFSVADTEGVVGAIRTYSIPGTSGDPAGLILNHYYAVEGSGAEYMRYADFVANVGNGAGTTMRFITKNAANTYSTGLKIDNNGKVYVNSGYDQGNFGMYIQGKGAGSADARALHVRGYGGHTTIGGTGPTLVLQNADGTTNNVTKLSFETASNGEAVSINCINTSHGEFYGDMAFNTRGAVSGYSEKLRIMANGNVGIGTTAPGEKLEVVGNTNVRGELSVTSGTFGSQLYTQANAASNPNGNEANATTGWAAGYTGAAMSSVGTENGVAPTNGSYQLKYTGTNNGARMDYGFSVVAGKRYEITLNSDWYQGSLYTLVYVATSTSGDNLGSAISSIDALNGTSYAEKKLTFASTVSGTVYLSLRMASTSSPQNITYIDNISIREIVGKNIHAKDQFLSGALSVASTITSAGNVGIGTSTPVNVLQIGSSFPITMNGNYPDIHFNSYYSAPSYRTFTTGFGGKLSFNGSTGKLTISTGASSTTAGSDYSPVEIFGLDKSGNLAVVGNVGMATGHSSGKFAVMSSSVHGSYDFYNNGTSYFNGTVIVDDHLNVTGTSAQLTLSRTSTDQTAGFNLTNNQNGGYGSGIVWQSKRSDSPYLLKDAAKIVVAGENAWNSDSNTASQMQFWTNKDNTLTKHMTLTKNGYLGIGTNDPQSILHVEGSLQKLEYPIINVASSQWSLIGQVTGMPQNGSTIRVRFNLHSGYNAADAQDYTVELIMKTANGASTGPSGAQFNSWWYKFGNSGALPRFKWVRSTGTDNYALYMFVPAFASGSHYIIEKSHGVWLHSGAVNQTDPGNDSSLVLEATNNLGIFSPVTVYHDFKTTGVVRNNGVREYSQYIDNLNNNSAISFDVPIQATGSGMTVYYECMYNHFGNTSYGSWQNGFFSFRSLSNATYAGDIIKTHGNASSGYWTVSMVGDGTSTPMMRFTKSAGSYSGSGDGHIFVRGGI